MSLPLELHWQGTAIAVQFPTWVLRADGCIRRRRSSITLVARHVPAFEHACVFFQTICVEHSMLLSPYTESDRKVAAHGVRSDDETQWTNAKRRRLY